MAAHYHRSLHIVEHRVALSLGQSLVFYHLVGNLAHRRVVGHIDDGLERIPHLRRQRLPGSPACRAHALLQVHIVHSVAGILQTCIGSKRTAAGQTHRQRHAAPYIAVPLTREEQIAPCLVLCGVKPHHRAPQLAIILLADLSEITVDTGAVEELRCRIQHLTHLLAGGAQRRRRQIARAEEPAHSAEALAAHLRHILYRIVSPGLPYSVAPACAVLKTVNSALLVIAHLAVMLLDSLSHHLGSLHCRSHHRSAHKQVLSRGAESL